MAGLKATSSPAPSSPHKDSDELDPLSSHPDDEHNSKSRRQSGYTAISSIPPSLPADDIPQVHRKHRPVFRSISSMRTLQLSSPSPLSSPQGVQNAERRKWSQSAVKRFATDEEESDPESLVEESEMLRRLMAHNQQGQPRSYRTASDITATSPYLQPQAPLILLHVSILPCPMPRYSHAVLQAHAPKHVIDNYQLLREKLSDVVLARGVLIPHPGEEYDVLEERLLEALELCAPRVLGCGHFFDDIVDTLSEGENSDKTATNDEDSLILDDEPRAICSYAHEEKSDELRQSQGPNHESDDLCDTCSQPMRLPYRGAGHGSRRWDVSFYAANGLMRSGAWSAAWREMERVDVEIMPWVPKSVKRALEKAAYDEHEAAMTEKREQQLHVEMLNVDIQAATQRIHQLEQDLLRAVAQEEVQKAALASLTQRVAQPIFNMPEQPSLDRVRQTKERKPASKTQLGDDIPLNRLLLNYIWILAQDKRNLAVGALSVLVLMMSILLTAGTTNKTVGQTIALEAPNPIQQIQAITSQSSSTLSDSLQNATMRVESPASFIATPSPSLEVLAPVKALETSPAK